jgi:3-isopropylmalate/(R)-2-methylmalate dehydratase large subunit
VLATQCLLQHKPKSGEVRIEGRLSKRHAKDIILALIAERVGGGTGHVFGIHR